MRKARLMGTVAAITGAIALSWGGSAQAAAPAVPTTAAGFVAQARAAGLTSAQAKALQNEVNRDLAAMGGKQVAPNRIQLDGATVRLAVPGEAHPRDLTAKADGASPLVDHCLGYADYGHMCAYSGTYYTGSEVDMYTCKRYYFSTWTGPGSWDNNQTTGTKARMYNSSGSLIYTTPGAHSWDATGDWTYVHSVINC